MKTFFVLAVLLLVSCGDGQPPSRDAAMTCAESLVPDGVVRSLDYQASTDRWAATGEIVDGDHVFVFVVVFSLEPCKQISLTVK